MHDTKPLLTTDGGTSGGPPQQSSFFSCDTEKQRKKCIVIVLVSILFIVAIILIVYFVVEAANSSSGSGGGGGGGGDDGHSNRYFERKFLEIPSNESCYALSRALAYEAHVAGGPQVLELASIMAGMYAGGFGASKAVAQYEVVRDDIATMVFDHWKASAFALNIDDNEDDNTTATVVEFDLANARFDADPDTNTSYRLRSWQPYSISGELVDVPLLYVNTASLSDLTYLSEQLSLNLSAYIAVVRAGSRATRVANVARFGMRGFIQFEDHFNVEAETMYAGDGTGTGTGTLRPNSGFMYGRIRVGTGCPGGIDPQRLQDQCGFVIDEANDLPYVRLFPSLQFNVPSIIISPDNAVALFRYFSEYNGLCDVVDGDNVLNGNSWFPGNLPLAEHNISLCLGGSEMGVTANLLTENEMNMNDSIQNLYAYFEGSLYPDEIVMIGAHRDAWALGACDDISGTVTMLEIARSLSVMRDEHGWQPKRTLMFGSWDGEEWGLYGSTEFNEQYVQSNDFIDKVVTYLNFDMTVVGPNFVLMGNPMLRTLLMDTAKDVLYPYTTHSAYYNYSFSSTQTLYDVWMDIPWNRERDWKLQFVTTGSDYGPFEYYSGIPSMGARFETLPFPDTYHAFYDVNQWMDLIDPEWQYAEHIAQFGGLVMLKVAQAHILPFNVSRLALEMRQWIDVDLRNRDSSLGCNVTSENWSDLEDVVDEFRATADLFMRTVAVFQAQEGIDDSSDDDSDDGSDSESDDDDDDDVDVETVKEFNGMLKQIMHHLASAEGIPSNKWYKNLVFNPGVKIYPYIYDVMGMSECEGEGETETLDYAFSVTAQYIADASAALSVLPDF